MSYNILGINPFHNGSACVLSDGEIIYFLEEERLTRKKYDANPFRVILNILNQFEINEVVIAGINANDAKLGYTLEDPFYALIRKFYPKLKFSSLSNLHHQTHCFQSFYNSGFKNSLGIVVDAGGSFVKNEGIEMDSIYICSIDSIDNVYKNFIKLYSTNPEELFQPLNIGESYSAISKYLGFKYNEEGKTMGLSSYGKYNSKLPSFFQENVSNIDILSKQIIKGIKNLKFYDSFVEKTPPPKSYSQAEKDLAWKIQSDTQQLVGDYIEKYIKETNTKQVCCSGGYFLNCVANYYLIKRFPNIEFYFEPISHDGGTAIGVAYHKWKEINPSFIPIKQNTLYYGPKYSKKDLLKGIQKYLD